MTIGKRLFVVYVLTFTLVAAAMFAPAYTLVRRQLEDELATRLTSTASVIAANLPGEYVAPLGPGDEESLYYRNLVERLGKYLEPAKLSGAAVFGTDGLILVDTAGSEIGVEYGRFGFDRTQITGALAGEAAASSTFEGPEGRLYKTGYARIELGGNPIGAIAVRAGAGFFDMLARARNLTLALAIVGLLLIAGVTSAVAYGITRPLARLATAAERMEAGDYDSVVTVEAGGEIGALSHAMEAMRKAVTARDSQLRMLAAGLAHEVRNPLGGIELFVGLLEEDLEEMPESLSALGKIKREVSNLNILVNEFMDFARDANIDPEVIMLGPWLSGVVDAMAADADSSGRALKYEEPRKDLRVTADPAKLERALLNLIKNGLDSASAAVTCRVLESPQVVTLEIEDDGPGIAAEHEEHLFDPFYTTKEKGSGLGLPLSRKIARAHGGELTLVNGEHGGCIARITLPRKDN